MSHTSKHKKASVVESFKDIIPLSFGEEIGNAASHGAAALLTLFVLPYAAVHSYNHGGTLESVSVSIYIISIFMMFISSTIYHSMQNYTAHKYILRIIDHSMIYVAISGTYTPVLLTIVGGWIGWVVTLFLWGTTLWGVIFIPVIIMRTSWLFILFIFLGGLSYTIGAWFYAQKNRPYFHMIWHIFIVIASVLHMIGILYFM